MRVTGGNLRGRVIRVPPKGVRPTQDRVREAFFSAVAERLPEGRFLDLFAGSGAVGIDAWSRGCRPVWWVESRRPVLNVLRSNVSSLCGARGEDEGDAREAPRVVASDVFKFLNSMAGEVEPFDIIYADPPYAKRRKGGETPLGPGPETVERLLSAIHGKAWLAPDGLVVVEETSDETQRARISRDWTEVWQREYGDTSVRMFRLKDEGGTEE